MEGRMVFIITGAVNSGKSTYLLSLYQKQKTGDGFYNRKLFNGIAFIGQELVWLSTEISCPFSFRINSIPEEWDELYTYKEYSFSKKGLLFAKSIISDILQNSEPAYIDELGPLELMEKGFYHEFQSLLKLRKDIYTVIRYECLSDIIKKFDINEYRIIKKL